jgi:hypothetical protein
MLDLAEAEQRQIFVEMPPPAEADQATLEANRDPNFAGGRVEAPPEHAQLLANVREAWGRYFADPTRVTERFTRTGVVSVSDAQMANPTRANVDVSGVPSLEESTRQYVRLGQENAYRFSDGPDGLFPLSQRLEGTSEGMKAELATDRENWRRIEYVRRFQGTVDELGALAGPDKTDKMVELAERGIINGEYDISSRVDTVVTPASPGVRGRTDKVTRYTITPTSHAENRELARAYARAFNKALQTEFNPAERTDFEAALGSQIVLPKRLDSMRTEGAKVQETGANEARRAQEAREAVSAAGMTPTERAQLLEQRRRDRAAQRRQVRTSLDFDAAYAEARANNSVFDARAQASLNMPAEFNTRLAQVQTEMNATTDAARRAGLRGEYDSMMGQINSVMDVAGKEQESREAAYASDPARFGPELTGPRQEARRNQLTTWFATGGGYARFDARTGRFRGADPGDPPNLWDTMSSLERKAATPYLIQARQARIDARAGVPGKGGEEVELLRQAAESRERAFAENIIIEKQIADTARDATSFVAQKAAEGLPGSTRIGRTTDEDLNADIVNEIRERFGMGREPDAMYIHRDEAPKRKNGEPRRGAVGRELCRDNIYMVPNQPNAVFVVRTNNDGQLVSADIHVTEGPALRQAHGSTFNRLTSGRFTDEADPALERLLTADFEQIKASVSDPAAADRRRGATSSIGNEKWAAAASAVAPYADYGTGYEIPQGDGGLWQLQPIRDRMIGAGFTEEFADRATFRRVERPREGQPRRWWWLNAVSRDYGESDVVRARRQAPGRFPRPTTPRS